MNIELLVADGGWIGEVVTVVVVGFAVVFGSFVEEGTGDEDE